MSVTKAQLAAIREQMNKALAIIAAANGLEELVCGKCTYSSDTFTMKVEARIKGGLTPEQQRYVNERQLGHHWWPERGSEIVINNQTHTIDGLTSGGCLLVKGSDGIIYRMKSDFIYKRFPTPKVAT